MDHYITKELQWKCEQLPSLPEFVPLAKTHKKVRGSCTSIVTKRICSYIASQSIIAEELDGDNARAVLRFTSGAVTAKIGLQLYSGEQERDLIIVEAVRLSGDALLYIRECKAILRAAKGSSSGSIDGTHRSQLRRPRHYKLLKPLPIGKYRLEESISAIENADQLIKKDRIDAKINGWTVLCSLTTAQTSDHACATYTSKVILGVDGGETSTDINMNVFQTLFDEQEACDTDVENHLSERIRDLAFCALNNALHTLQSHRSLKSIMQENTYIESELVSLLIDRVSSAAKKPYEAYLSAACLETIMQASAKARQNAAQYGAQDVLMQGKYTGECFFHSLATASQHALVALQVS
mmetsp:Transcript_6877/g.10132  ORF Transcript_6877/g.10132 Transcript_6877/m.10132 type:complete len:353 (+) Transcript_6877:58-1116(+)